MYICRPLNHHKERLDNFPQTSLLLNKYQGMKISNAALAISGAWNTKIFTPNWVMGNLLQFQEGDEIEVGMSKDELRPVFRYKGVVIIPKETVFNIRIDGDIDDATLNLANSIGQKLIELHPYTPNLAIGFNFKVITGVKSKEIGFEIVPRENGELLSFETNKLDDFELSSLKFTRILEDSVCNVSVSFDDDDNEVLNYNYHYEKLDKVSSQTFIEKFSELKSTWS